MRAIRWIPCLLMFFCTNFSLAQKTISEGTITYNIVIQTGSNEPQMADALDGAVTTLSIKGGLARTDMISALGSETTIHDARTGTAVILKEYSGQKLMYILSKENWTDKNKKYSGLSFENTAETTTIAGYNCKKAIATLKDGSKFWVYYTTDLIMLNKDYNETFRNLPGLALQYEYESGKLKFRYTVSQIDFNPVPQSKFDTPKSGYRIMEYKNETK